ncbi:MAG TPA: metal-dependent transcriptional regulator [Candidatus Dojkabacteria bacterium]|jgi:Mn-dependent DtxR family transcriptional regulator
MQEIKKIWKYYQEYPISHSTAHYLMTILDLTNESGYARVTDIANKLNISVGSCHTTVQNLKKKQFVEEDKNKFLKLTQKGAFVAEHVKKNEEILFDLFTKVFDIEEEVARIDACKLEHLLSKQTTEKIEKFLKNYRPTLI